MQSRRSSRLHTPPPQSQPPAASQIFTLPCYFAPFSTAVETAAASTYARGVAYTTISQVTTAVTLGASAYSAGAVYAAVHVSSGGPFYVSGTTSPFVGYFSAAGALKASIYGTVVSKLFIYSDTLYGAVGSQYGYFGTKYTLPTASSTFTALLTHVEAISSFQIQTDTVVW